MNKMLLKVKNLEVSTETKSSSSFFDQGKKKTILKDFNLNIKENQIHVLIGPNGCGKSTFSKVLTGHPDYQVENGQIQFNNKNLLGLSAEERALEGIFLAFQYPPEISGVPTYDFLRVAYNQKQKYLKKKELDPIEFFEKIQPFFEKLKFHEGFLKRNFNEGFSGGEKKKNEILQMLILEPKLIILDEIDSGLDIDALKFICQILKENLANKSSLLLITHNPKMIDYISPDYIHLMIDGKISSTGHREVLEMVEKQGYYNAI